MKERERNVAVVREAVRRGYITLGQAESLEEWCESTEGVA